MPPVRPHRRPRQTLADLVDLDDVESAVDGLLDMPEQDFDNAVTVYLRGDRRGMEAMRHPDLIERLYESLTRLRDERRHRYRESGAEHHPQLRGELQAIEIERREIRPVAEHERRLRLADEASERAARRARREESKLERALELRRQLEEAQRSSPRKRAMQRLTEKYPREFLTLVREEQEKDAREHTQLDGEGAADPPGPTAPSIPTQAARS